MKTNLGNIGHSAHLRWSDCGIIICIIYLSNNFTNQYVLYLGMIASINCIICNDLTEHRK